MLGLRGQPHRPDCEQEVSLVLQRMAEWYVGEVVQERCQPNEKAWVVINRHDAGRTAVVLVVTIRDLEQLLGPMQRPQGVREPSVNCTWIYEVGRPELGNVAKTLKAWRVDERPFQSCDRYVPVNRVSNELMGCQEQPKLSCGRRRGVA